MTAVELGVALAVFCSGQTKTSEYTKNQDCIDFLINCSIPADSNIDVKKVEECKIRFKQGEKYRE